MTIALLGLTEPPNGPVESCNPPPAAHPPARMHAPPIHACTVLPAHLLIRAINDNTAAVKKADPAVLARLL